MPGRILLVDDDREMVALGRLILEGEGYVVLSAYDGPEAIACLLHEQGQVDLVLLDVMMTGMDGWQVLAQLKSDNRFSHIPVIMVSARVLLHSGGPPTGDQHPPGCYEHFEHYVKKPFEVPDFLMKIESVLKGAESPNAAKN